MDNNDKKISLLNNNIGLNSININDSININSFPPSNDSELYEIHEKINKVHTVVSFAYNVVCILTIIQGVGIILLFNLKSLFIGSYLILLSTIAVLFDNKPQSLNDYDIQYYFKFLDTIMGRSLLIMYFGIMSMDTVYTDQWNILIVIIDSLVSITYTVIYLFDTFKGKQFDDLTDIYSAETDT